MVNGDLPIVTGNNTKDTTVIASECQSLPSWATSYPSQSLRFLQNLEKETLSRNDSQPESAQPTPTRLKLNIIIVGAGLGGLALAIALRRRGHSVRILEQAPKLGEVGAGIQIPPNSGRLLRRWGVMQHLEKWVVKPQGINFRRWEDGKVIGHTALGEQFQDNFEEPYYVVHRAHFHDALLQRALQLGVKIDLGCKVVQYHEAQGSVRLADGSVVQGDLVVAADGIHSVARGEIYREGSHEPVFNGFAAYRATVDANMMREDPHISWLLEKPSLNVWIGEDRHVMSYTIAAGEAFNIVLSHVDRSGPATWTQKFAKEHIQKEFGGWDPQLTKVISLIDQCMKWPLKTGQQLKSWTSQSSKLIIIGDAAHAMLPYMSQGAAMAVEDGAALAVALNQISSVDALPSALRTFEGERIQRSSDMQNASRVNGLIWHFPDGPEQRARDATMVAEVAGKPFTSSANQWSDPVTQWWAYGYDAESKMEEAWRRQYDD
ncbi:FAD/NAD(P)-binding domain-containing protein [Setomelanomma holmii]|uniref:FAD/NAD(P)-binding domain-containing protein n=1 Tax=Setomelanomma holmii TaxID=210430 RepID=A0A9P4HDE5_9PLEO|nr:FAD/NAD(P)-binding domain-containing protein [Setomelanomma holmii]